MEKIPCELSNIQKEKLHQKIEKLQIRLFTLNFNIGESYRTEREGLYEDISKKSFEYRKELSSPIVRINVKSKDEIKSLFEMEGSLYWFNNNWIPRKDSKSFITRSISFHNYTTELITEIRNNKAEIIGGHTSIKYRKEKLIPFVKTKDGKAGGLLTWKCVNKDGKGVHGFPYKVGEHYFAASSMACAGPYGAFSGYSSLYKGQQKVYLLAILASEVSSCSYFFDSVKKHVEESRRTWAEKIRLQDEKIDFYQNNTLDLWSFFPRKEYLANFEKYNFVLRKLDEGVFMVPKGYVVAKYTAESNSKDEEELHLTLEEGEDVLSYIA